MTALIADHPARLAAEHATAFRKAMAHLASAVAIVACRWEGRPYGLLVSSLTSLSLEPPRLLFCVRKAASCHDRLLYADRVSVAVLSGADLEEARTFTEQDRAAERFASSRWRHGTPGPPHLDGGVVNLDCAIHQRICAGTHTIFIVDVGQVRSQGDDPLLYFRGRYRRLAEELTAAAP